MESNEEANRTKEFYEFKKQLELLSKFRGRGTELISVYIPPGYQISDVTSKLREEAGAATNIKSASTRKNVISALEKIVTYLKTFKQPPATGMAVFCGNISEVEGRPDLELYSVIPPVPVGVQFYRCESQFVLEPLEELVNARDRYGIVVLDGKEATVAILDGKQIKIIKQVHSTAHAKTHKGGQSSQRFGRLREEGIEYFYSRIAEAMDSYLQVKNFKGVIVGGPGPTKESFLKEAAINYQIKVLGVVDTGYTDEYGIREAMSKADDILAEHEATKERKVLEEFMKEISTNGLATYGFDQIKNALVSGQASELLVSEELEFYEVKMECNQCGKTVNAISNKKIVPGTEEENCSCGGKLKVKEDVDLINDLIGIAQEKGIPVVFISNDTSEGQQFRATFNGLGAFLRYK